MTGYAGSVSAMYGTNHAYHGFAVKQKETKLLSGYKKKKKREEKKKKKEETSRFLETDIPCSKADNLSRYFEWT